MSRDAGRKSDGGGTLREVRPCFVNPHPQTPQVLWHWLYECACRIQTHQLSVWLSMSPEAEPISWDKAELIVLSSASQRESFFTWTRLCTMLHITSISDYGPTWYLFFCPSVPPPIPFSFFGSHRLSTMNHLTGRIPSPFFSVETSFLVCTNR